MSSKVYFVFCAYAFFVQSVFSQCTSRAAIDASGLAGPYGLNAPGLAYDGMASPIAYEGFAAPGLGLAGPLAYDGYAAGPCNRGLGYDGVYATGLDFTPTSGGGLQVTSASAIPPTGISVISDNVYEGNLAVSGQIPFVGTTGVEGVLYTAGAGAVNHACGNGINAMSSDNAVFAPEYATGAYGPAAAAAVGPFAAAGPFATAGPFAASAYAPSFAPAAAFNDCGRGMLL